MKRAMSCHTPPVYPTPQTKSFPCKDKLCDSLGGADTMEYVSILRLCFFLKNGWIRVTVFKNHIFRGNFLKKFQGLKIGK